MSSYAEAAPGAVACTAENADTGQETSSAQPSATVRLSVPRVFATKKGATARDADPIRCRFGHRGAGLRRLERTALPAAIPASLTSVLSGTVLCWIRINDALDLEGNESASYPTRPIVGRKQAGRCRRPGGGGSWDYSAFHCILPDLTPNTNRSASRFAAAA